MRRSDIFDDFAKIAQEMGIISTASPEEIKNKLENNPRMDSLDISAIEALYGLKPDAPKEMQYKRNIIENAHPKPVVLSPAHDKLNGLVENLNERQDILMHILQKTPDGHLTQKKYAEKEMLLALVRIGNDLDNKNQEELRALADTCLEQTATIIKKAEFVTTAGSLAIAGLVAIPVILGGIYVYQHMSFLNEGFLKNHEKLIAEIDDLLNASVSWGVGRQYTQDFLQQMTEFRAKLMEMLDNYNKVYPILKSLERARTGKELLELAKSGDAQAVIEAYNFMRSAIGEFLPYINKIEQNLKSETYKIRQIEDKGWIEKAIDWTQILHGGWGLIADDFDDVVRTIGPYKKSIAELLKVFADAESQRKDAQRQLDAARSSASSEFGPSTYTAPTAPSPTPTTTISPAQQKNDTERDAERLNRELDELGGLFR